MQLYIFVFDIFLKLITRAQRKCLAILNYFASIERVKNSIFNSFDRPNAINTCKRH